MNIPRLLTCSVLAIANMLLQDARAECGSEAIPEPQSSVYGYSVAIANERCHFKSLEAAERHARAYSGNSNYAASEMAWTSVTAIGEPGTALNYRAVGSIGASSEPITRPPLTTTTSYAIAARNWPPPAVWTACAAERAACSASGGRCPASALPLHPAKLEKDRLECMLEATWSPPNHSYCWNLQSLDIVETGTPFGTPVFTGSGSAGQWFSPPLGTSMRAQLASCPVGSSAKAQKAAQSVSYGVSKQENFSCQAGFTASQAGGGSCQSGYFKLQVDATSFKQHKQCPKRGNPCVPGTGNKEVTELDFEYAGVRFERTYNSVRELRNYAFMDRNWTHSFATRLLTPYMGVGHSAATGKFIQDQSGMLEEFIPAPTASVKRSAVTEGKLLLTVANGWQLVDEGPEVTHFDDHGRPTQVVHRDDPRRTLQFQYVNDTTVADRKFRVSTVRNGQNRGLNFEYLGPDFRLARITSESGLELAQYSYDAVGNLASVTTASGTRRYLYNEPAYLQGNFPHHLTGILDEQNGRFASYGYDDWGRVTDSWHGGGDAGRVSITYPTDSTVVVQNPSGEIETITYAGEESSYRRSLSEGSVDRGFTTRTYDSLDRLTSETDQGGAVTRYEYLPGGTGKLAARVEASGTPEARTIAFEWSTSALNRIAVQKTYKGEGQNRTLESMRRTSFNDRSQVIASCEIDPAVSGAEAYVCGLNTNAPSGVRQTTHTYCAQKDVDQGLCPVRGLLLRIDGPRIDIADTTDYQYYADDHDACASVPAACEYRKGDLSTVTNALGHATEYLKYDGAGRALSTLDANGVLTDLVYHERGWPTHRKVRGTDPRSETDDKITEMQYEPTGLVRRVIQPDGSYTHYTYDDAHRLKAVADNFGNKLVYSLDDAGNRTVERTLDPGGTLKRRLARQFNQLGQLRILRDAMQSTGVPLTGAAVLDPSQGRITSEHTYDASSNPDITTDGRGTLTNQDHDPLGRLSKALQDVGAVPHFNAETNYEYDARDNLRKVIDPKRLPTDYVYDGHNNLRELRSPDTGTTVYTYDEAGNRKTQRDARNVEATYTYDALNRLTAITYPTPGQNVSFIYDQMAAECNLETEAFAEGRLTRIVDHTGYTAHCYDRFGNLTRKSQRDTSNPFALNLAHDLAFKYDAAGRVTSITYPHAARISYARDAAGRVQQVSYRAPAQSGETVLVSGVTYYPYGPVQEITYGNGRKLTRTLDQNYTIDRVESENVGGIDLDFTTDIAGNITGLATGGDGNAFDYDRLQRLTRVLDLNQSLIAAYEVDATGNRKSKQVGASTQLYVYPPDSHRLQSVGGVPRTYDAAGNTTSRGTGALTYGNRGRLDAAPGFTYAYNARGERIRKVAASSGSGSSYVPTLMTHFVYDESGHVLFEQRRRDPCYCPPGEYCPAVACDIGGEPMGSQTAGTAAVTAGGPNVFLREAMYVWLDDLPIGVLDSERAAPPILAYIEPDHLGTPRAAIDPARNTAIWKWPLLDDAFGEGAPLTDPDADGQQFTLNLRFPGHYFDQETGLHYNMARDYEPRTGRYVESDPIGLNGGISTYGYVGGSPLLLVDPLGLKARVCCRKIPWLPAAHCFIEEDYDDIDEDFCGPPCESKKRTIGLQGPPPFGDSSNGGGQTFTDHGFDDPNKSKCGSWTTDCQLSNCLDRELAAYKNPSRYSGPGGPNSNTFAYTLMNQCGLTPPARGWPKPGWGQQPAGPQ